MKSKRTVNGYTVVYKPDHPKSMKTKNWNGYVYEHIVVAEQKIDRNLVPGEEVHHLDLVRSNNDPRNLLILEKSQHTALHNWISRGAPMSKDIGEQGVNSVKAKVVDTRYCSRNGCGNVIHNPKAIFCSSECSSLNSRRVERPNCVKLDQELNSHSFSALSRKYGVSDNAIRKWSKQCKLPS
jgi:hypothetical protein